MKRSSFLASGNVCSLTVFARSVRIKSALPQTAWLSVFIGNSVVLQLFEELDRRPVMAVGLRAVQVGPVEAVDGQQGALEAVTHVGHVRQPAQVRRDRVERDEEAREQQNRDRCDRTQVHRRLQFQINSILIQNLHKSCIKLQNLHKITKFA